MRRESTAISQLRQLANRGPIANWTDADPRMPGIGGEVCVTKTQTADRGFIRAGDRVP